jgi:beta-glucosidase
MAEYQYPFQNPELSHDERARDVISRLTLEEKAGLLLHGSKPVPRLGIPEYNWWNECLHGVARAGRATIFPQAIGMAAAFDDTLMNRVASAISDEARAKHAAAVKAGNRGWYKGLTFWTPNINIFRDPRWGRGQETYGEDPYLTSRLGVSFVKGLQQEKNGRMKAAACAKHFAAHSGPEALRHEFDATVSEKDLRETYLPAFKALVTEAKVESVMGAYNRTNGEPCCASPTLIQKILRKEWGFKGHVVSDCWAIMDFHLNHKITKTVEESAALALNNGLQLNCGCAFDAILPAVEQGLVSEKVLDEALYDLFVIRFKLGLLDPEERNPWRDIPESVIDCDRHRALARETAAKSIVLLKNDNNLLPLGKNLKKVYITGPNATNIDAMLANYYGMNSRIVTPFEGITGKITEDMNVDYRLGSLLDRDKPNPVDWASFEAKNNDVVIACLGIDGSLEGEEGDSLASPYKGDRLSIEMPRAQVDFLKKLKIHGKPVVAVILGGSPIELGEVHELADAIIWAWYPGEEGGNAIADVLFGDTAPAGKLPITFPKSLAQLPPYESYSMEGRTYRFMKEEPLYPFGFGLTYAPFRFGDLKTDRKELKEGDSLAVSVTLTNTGTCDSDEVVQLYVTDLEATTRVPLSTLRGFRRVHVKKGASETIRFDLTTEALKLVDDSGREILEKGDFRITVGSCSPGARGTALGAPEPVSTVIRVV